VIFEDSLKNSKKHSVQGNLYSSQRENNPSYSEQDHLSKLTNLHLPSTSGAEEKKSDKAKNSKEPPKEKLDEKEMEELEEAIGELGLSDCDSSTGLKNLNYIKRKLFDSELEMILKRFDERIS